MQVGKHSQWLKSPHVAIGIVALVTLAWSVAIVALFLSPYGMPLERLARQLDFAVRDNVGHAPELHSRLKVFGVDDKSVAWLNSAQLSMEEWAQFLYRLDLRQPSAIYIDAMFSVRDVTLDRSENLDLAVSTIRNLKSPVYVGAFTTKHKIAGREPLPVEEMPAYDLRAMMQRGGYQRITRSNVSELRLSSALGSTVYGPDPSYRDSFRGIGHIQYDGSDQIKAFIRVSPSRVIPHLAFTGMLPLEMRGGSPYYGTSRVPVDSSGNLLVNWVSPNVLYGNTFSIAAHLQKALRREELNIVRPGDVVVVLPAMFTGNTDFKESPYGAVPGGFHIVSVLNSVLRNDWLVKLEGVQGMIVAAAAVGAVLGARLSPTYFAGAAASIGILSFVFLQYLFVARGLTLAWIFPMLSFFAAGITTLVERARIAERKSFAVRQALDGAIAPQQLAQLAKNPHLVNLEARERVVTVVFVDVVGFSLMAENLLPRLAFDHLKHTLNAITKIVYQYGGIINKNLGDGLLCIFGYDIETDQTSTDHAEQAVVCAIKIQELCLQENLRAAQSGHPVYPLRIGINTSSVYMGDLGYGERIDFTVVGNGVNFAKRLEGACEPYSVLMSNTTLELVRSLMLNQAALVRKKVQIKHHHDLIETVEYDPFYDRQDLRQQAMNAFRQCTKLARSQRRWVVTNPQIFILRTSVGPGELVNFSNTGVSIRLPAAIARGGSIAMQIDSQDGSLQKKLGKMGVGQLLCEVRWQYHDRGGYVHGLSFTQISETQGDGFVEQMRRQSQSGVVSAMETPVSRHAG